MQKSKFILILLVTIFIWLVSILFDRSNAHAIEIDELLLDYLVEKGILTQEEASAIRADAAIKTQDESSHKKSYAVEGKTKFDFSGYLQGQYVADVSEGKYDEFKVRRARLDFRGDVSREIGWRLQIDAVQPLKSVVDSVTQNTKTKDITSSTTKAVTRPILLDAHIDYKLHPFANFRLGQFKLPFGRENLESSPKLDSINRSQVTEKLVPGRDNASQGRDIGTQVAGEFDFETDRKIIEYSIAGFNGAGINAGDDNEYKDAAGRLLVYPFEGTSIGIAHYNGKSGSKNATKLRTGAELACAIYDLSLKGEYVFGKDDVVDKYGWYAQVGYRFIPELEGILKYDSYDPDKDKSGDRTDVATFGLNWFINKWAKIQANYEWKIEEGNNVNNNVFLTQFQIQF